MFTIWTHGVPCLNVFLQELNNYHTTIQFKADWSAQIGQLDMRVYIKSERVETDLHVKPTSKHQYLHTKIVILNTARLPYHIVKLLQLKEIVRSGRTYYREQIN